MSSHSKRRTSSASQEAESSERPNKAQKRNHTSRACNGCRQRKTKCDGNKPSCGTCLTYNDECSYSPEQDRRKTAPKQYVSALEQRIKFLEALLKERDISHDSHGVSNQNEIPGDDRSVHSWQYLGDREDGEENEDIPNGNDLSISRLKLDDETGELRQYGPTSVFMHLPEPTGPFLSASESEVSSDNTSHIHAWLSRVSSPPSPNSSAQTPDTSPVLDWSRNLPHIEGMDQALHDQLLVLFFTYFNDWCCWVNPSLFFRDMLSCLSAQANNQSRTSYYSPLLHNAVLSMAGNYCEDPRLGTHDRGRPFAITAIEAIEIEGERPMLSTVSGLMLLGSYHSGNAKQSLGYLYAGMGLRMCQTLGLGIDCSSSNLISASLKRERDRTFYMAYIQDKLWGAYVGRSASMILSDHETPLPSVDTQRDEAPWIPWDKPPSDSVGESSNQLPMRSWASTNFLWTCKLAALSERVTETLYSLHANIFSARTQDAVSALNLQLGEWFSNLPPDLAISPYSSKIPPPHVIMLHAMYHFVVILLHRPYYSRNRSPRQTPLHELSVTRCDAAASKVVHLIELYRKVPGLRYGTISLTQITFTAGTIHLLGAVSHENSRSEKRFRTALAGARECVKALEEMGRAWQCATQSGQVLDNLIRDWCPQGTRVEGEAVSLGEVILETGKETPMNVNLQQTLQNPSSDLAKELLRLGWTPPTQTLPAQPPKTASIPTTLTSRELPPSTFSTLDQLSVLRESGVQQQYRSPDLELSWDPNQQQLSGSPGNLFGLENSFGWGYMSNWEYGQGAYSNNAYPHGQGSSTF